MKKDPKVSVTISFPISVWDRIDDAAYRERTNRSKYLLKIVLGVLDAKSDKSSDDEQLTNLDTQSENNLNLKALNSDMNFDGEKVTERDTRSDGENTSKQDNVQTDWSSILSQIDI